MKISRFNCHCGDCRQKGSGQKTISPLSWPSDLELEAAFFVDDVLKFRIKGEDHEGMIPGEVLRKFVRDEVARTKAATKMIYERITNPEVDFLELENEAGKHALTKNVMEDGYCVIKGCESKIAPPVTTLYGVTQEIKNGPNPINIALSGIYLGPHMDYPYMESPPGVSFMLCRRNDECVEGGESIMIDAFEVAEESDIKIHWDRDDPVYIEWEQPHIVVDGEGVITRINWGPAFEGKSKNVSMTSEYLKAYRFFMEKVNESPTKTIRKLDAGECLVAYLNICEFRSKAQIHEITQGDGQLVKMI
ncbi:Oidioi.mRNA.OKI2018_I69.PAR.g9268.t1.cds [Oikopleura dioica]|uniref:Oidioi.mRNA.OKI2018_I69.PAR.g9268.t1.cds n=1 Tax=Oikopleura dioica TaxID=34765 RepID=A0ABN7RP17_OIKDI|nr:Oidioi.mRNA.OKI2018_I69.PAR.g9268.t1.cds [Oikopleura dioica]